MDRQLALLFHPPFDATLYGICFTLEELHV